jgi:hypothetical protein
VFFRLYCTRSVLTLARSASEGHNLFPRLRFGLTHRAASGGTLTARELWFEGLWFRSLSVSILVLRVARQWPYTLWCLMPEG